jgi:2-oxoglutarate dehydrogenase E1 component
MTPKSLLRHPKVISAVTDFVDGSFQQVLDDSCDPARVDRVLLCSGKVYYDLLAQREATGKENVALVRIELLYPFPERSLGACLKKYTQAGSVIWIQEEHRNSGAWAYMHERFSLHFPKINLKYLGRDESASSATGSFKQYQKEQKKLVEDAFE